jgi:hypothetical protein
MASQPKEFALTFLNNFPAQLKQAQKIITSQWKKSRINEWLTKHEMEFEDPGQRGGLYSFSYFWCLVHLM